MVHFRILEFWRLAAALAVMVYHFLRFAPEGQNGAANTLYLLLPLMDMFFMISGFLIMLRYGDTLLDSRRNYWQFILRRFVRIYPIYLATLLFFILVGLAISSGYGSSGWDDRFNFSTLPQNILLVQSWGLGGHLTFNYVAWTLAAEWFCYLTLPVIVLVFLRMGVPGLIALSAMSIAALHWASVAGYIPDGYWLRTYAWGAYRAFADFALGALIAVLARSSTIRWRTHLPAWFCFVGSIVLMLNQANGYIVLACLAISIFLAAIAERNNPEGSRFLTPLQPIGQVSFGIYMLHPVIEAILLSILWRRLLEPAEAISFFTYWYIPMVATILLALASDRYFERPVAKAILRRIEGPPKPKGGNPVVAPAE